MTADSWRVLSLLPSTTTVKVTRNARKTRRRQGGCYKLAKRAFAHSCSDNYISLKSLAFGNGFSSRPPVVGAGRKARRGQGKNNRQSTAQARECLRRKGNFLVVTSRLVNGSASGSHKKLGVWSLRLCSLCLGSVKPRLRTQTRRLRAPNPSP